VTCGNGSVIAPAQFVLPDPQPLISQLANVPQSVTVKFAIDTEGRPFDVSVAAEPRFRPLMRDLIPSLRASRFVAGASQTGCTIQYTPEMRSIAEAPLETLARLGVAQRLRVSKEVWNRIAPGDCRDTPRLAPLARSYPDFRKLTRREGSRHWTYVTYDVDSEGVPVNLATPFTTGYAALDAEARAAVAAGRYAGGPRTGCVQAWWTGAETIPAPPIPPKDNTQGNPACEIKDRWGREPRLVFPDNYQQRAIEGWAILRYDVAPWGQIGEVEVLEAQPSSEFGEAATSVIGNARYKPLETGLKGCIDRVIFRIRSRDDGSEESGTADPA
jgi:TonB family protein